MRILSIILAELTSDKLKIEEELERLGPSDTPTDVKVVSMKQLIKDLTIIELAIEKWQQTMVSNDITNNK